MQKVAGSNPVRPTTLWQLHDLSDDGDLNNVSGVEISKEQKQNLVHECDSCMNTVIQTFGYMQQKVQVLETEKAGLQTELAKVREDYAEKIRVLKERVAELQKELDRQ